MKKILMLLSLVVVFAFSACKPTPQPEGGDDSKTQKRISKIYADYGYGKKLDEVWNWDNEQLKKIEYYNSDNKVSYEEYYTYNDKGQVVRIENYGDDEYIEFNYDGNKLTKARLYYDGELEEDWRFSYENDKISKAELVYVAKAGSAKNISTLKMILPFDIANNVSDIMAKDMLNNSHRGGCYLELTWDNDNISKVEYVDDGDRTVLDYKYDNKLNPFNNIWRMYVEECIVDFGNKNNVTQIVSSYNEDGESSNEVTNYSYSYEGDYPIVKKIKDNILNYVWYYEYMNE